VCKVCNKSDGVCVNCHHCRTPVHVECAHQAGYFLGFDITPVKGSRRDQFNIVSIKGESGTMSAAVWCKDHVPTKTIVHRMHELVDENGTNALQLYVQNFKQADLTLTGCARKAIQITPTTRTSTSPSTTASIPNRRASLTAQVNGDHRASSPSAAQSGSHICLTCGTEWSPCWHPITETQERELTNGYFGNLGSEAQKFVEQRTYQCHKCKKQNRQPIPHKQVSKEPTPPPPEPVRQVSQTPSVVPSPPVGPAEPRHASRSSYSWSPQLQPPLKLMETPRPVLNGPTSSSIAAPLVAPPAQSSSVAPPPLPPAIAPRGPSIQPHSYAPPRPFNDWHRPAPHGPTPVHPSREINGGPSPPPINNTMPPLVPHNHLRPPSISTITHSPVASTQNGHMSQSPYVNGMPPSPRRLSGPPLSQNGLGYMSAPLRDHHSHGPDMRQHSLGLNHQIPQGVPGPMVQEPPQSAFSLRQWSNPHHPVSHHTTSLAREGPQMGREPSIPPPQRENRPASGASASPSLRNLLS